MQQIGHFVNMNELSRLRVKLTPNGIEELIILISNTDTILNLIFYFLVLGDLLDYCRS